MNFQTCKITKILLYKSNAEYTHTKCHIKHFKITIYVIKIINNISKYVYNKIFESHTNNCEQWK